jgi:hypothetical protein
MRQQILGYHQTEHGQRDISRKTKNVSHQGAGLFLWKCGAAWQEYANELLQVGDARY